MDKQKIGIVTNSNTDIFNEFYTFLIKTYNIEGYFITNNIDSKFDLIKTFNKLLIIDYILPLKLINLCKENNVKLIYWRIKNDFISDTFEMLNNGGPTLSLNHLYDEIWISSHLQYSLDYYKYIHQTENILISPFFWINNKILLNNKKSLNNNFNEINVCVFEDNINFNNSCFIPVIICEKAKDYINKTYILNSKKFFDKSKLFREFANKSELFKQNKMTFEEQHKFEYVMSNYCNIVISFTENNDLNHLFFKCFYLGIPLIHNSKILKNYGYYYEDYNLSQAVEHIKNIKLNFNKEEYISKHKYILYKHSLENPEIIYFFSKKLGLEKNKFYFKNYNRKENWHNREIKVPNLTFGDRYIFYEDIFPTLNEKIISINYNKQIKEKKIYSFVISVDEVKKNEMKSKLEKDYLFIDAITFNKNISPTDKSMYLGFNHINCWKKALEMNLEEAFIFEDDVVFIKNWRNIVNNFIQNNNVNIIKFDALPYRRLPDSENIKFYLSFESACLGGYYITKKVMEYGIELFNNLEWNFNTCEDFVALVFQKFEDSLYTSVPRICIQDWFKNSKSCIQANKHIEDLKNMQIYDYLPKYGNFYNL